MQIHGSCASRAGDGVLLIGPPGAGKSDLLLRLLARGFDLVADDRVDIVDGVARPVPALAGLLEVRGLGIVRLPHVAAARLALVVELATPADRLPAPARHDALGSAAGTASIPGPPPRRNASPWRSTVRWAASPRSPEPSRHERRTPAGRAGHRPLGRRQVLGAAGAGGPGLRGGRQSAAADARGHGDAQRAQAGDRRRCAHTRLRRRPRAGDPGAAARQSRRCGRSWSSPGRTKPRCCAATPRPGAAIRWRRRAGSPTASRARRCLPRRCARGRTW